MKKRYLAYTGIILAAILVIIATGIIVPALIDSHEINPPVLSDTGVKANPAVPVPTGLTTTATDSSSEKTANKCSMVRFEDVNVPSIDGFSYYNTSAFTAVSAGNYSSQYTKKGAVITREEAESIARSAFPQYSPDRIEMEYSDGSVNNRMWHFNMRMGDQQLVVGTLDAYTGDLMLYSVVSHRSWIGPVEVPHLAATTMESARLTAEDEIRERNGELPLQLIDSHLDGNEYLFNYRRIIQGVPCSNNGFNIRVDPGTGNVVMYYKAWDTPENAVAAQSVPAISRDAAIALVEREAKACYPESAGSFRIVSADLLWMDTYNHEKYLPLPGVIPLVWRVRFDDNTIRAWQFPVPEEGWVDAQNGTLLSITYFHNRSGP
ncbi:MAG: DUF4901 domain-containing protein [Methanoregula sp.]|nr:DUF4901 domain-containing protein [Methanoregula sp.]